MKRSVVTILAGAAIAVAASAAAAVGSKPCCATPALAATAGGASHGVAQANEAKVAIEIPEVECAGCSLRVRQAIKAKDGVLRLSEGDPKNRIVVTYTPGSGRPDVYVEALRSAGFAKARVVAGQS